MLRPSRLLALLTVRTAAAAHEDFYVRACCRFVTSSAVGYDYPADWPIAGAGLPPAG